jgi:AraC-like DNA-binding protein
LTAPPSAFQRALALLENEICESASLTAVRAMCTRLGRVVVAGLLVSQPNNYTDQLTRPAALPASRAIRRALEFIEDRPNQIETVADIASEVGLSVRALEDGFLRYVATPPMPYFRQVLMSRAHDDLVSADPRPHEGHNHRAALGGSDTTGGSPPSIGAATAASHPRHCGPADLCRPLRARGRTAPNTAIRAVCCRPRTTVAQRSGCIVHRMTRRQRGVEDRVVRSVESPRARAGDGANRQPRWR